ncbi:glycoside hydrolase family 26 protein [Micromonospora sp. NPDC048830]|uniref:glycoside hydrolase family 26 protein n=1 Tax=Micromonospora sp. NPDC048830 TaxID=3364257 RepID=UPI00371024E3
MARLSVPRVMMALAGALLLTYAFAVAPRAAPLGREPAGSTASSPPAPALFPPAGKTFVGIMTREGPYDFTPVEAFTAAAQRQPQVMLFSAGWAATPFDRALFDRISGRGMLPMLGWEPWDQRVDEEHRRKGLKNREIDKIRANQPGYGLSRIADGSLDGHLRSWAEGIRSLGYPVAIRFAHEMNGDWYPWCESVNGNRPGDYVRAWRHVHDLFEEVGATNVTWVWSPNVRWDDSDPKLSTFYPGDAYVDWVGLSGYYGTGAFAAYLSFDAIFKRSIDEIRTFSRRPLVVTETGASDAGGRKAEWITETFRVLPSHPDVIGVIWFEVNKERDWRIVSSPAVARAFAKAVAVAQYDFGWSPDTVPRTDLPK